MSETKTAPCKVCGKPLPLPPWPIVEGSLECLTHREEQLREEQLRKAFAVLAEMEEDDRRPR